MTVDDEFRFSEILKSTKIHIERSHAVFWNSPYYYVLAVNGHRCSNNTGTRSVTPYQQFLG